MMLLEQTVLAAERAHEERRHHAQRFNVSRTRSSAPTR
jgi:hypothetical protein